MKNLGAILIALISSSTAAQNVTTVDREDAAVIATVLLHFAKRTDTIPRMTDGDLEIVDSTCRASHDRRESNVSLKGEGLPSGTTADVLEGLSLRNSQCFSLRPLADLGKKFIFVSPVQAARPADQLPPPNVINTLRVFAPGYSINRRTAIAQLQFQYGAHGAYATYLLALRKGKWRIVQDKVFVPYW
jgi:hypothetical protein